MLTPTEFALKLDPPASPQLIRHYCKTGAIKCDKKKINGGFQYSIPVAEVARFTQLRTGVKKKRGWPLGKKRTGSTELENPPDQFENARARLYKISVELNQAFDEIKSVSEKASGDLLLQMNRVIEEVNHCFHLMKPSEGENKNA
jgi:hypothetical protein